jgi:CheY-like chemotaxis protein
MRRLVCDEKLLQHLEVIHTAAADAAATVSRIQTFARQTSSREPELLDAGALVRDAVEITRSHWLGNAGQAKHDVVLDLEDGLYVMGIASELREVLVNLIVNAVDAMPDGGRLTISGARVLDRLRLCFADTGSGMTDAVRERIFEPFYTTKGPGGTGLGLFVSYGIIAQHQGTIYVASEPGRGTTFTIDLPAAGPVAGNRAQPPAGTPGSPLSVLIVDDEPVVRETLADMLEALQHRAVVAESGPKALAALASQRFDLVITDLTMPEMTGQELVQAVRRAHPHVRIIVMTGYGQESATVQTELADGVLDKPFSFAQVEDMIARVTADAATDKALDGTGERLKKSRL